MSVVILRLLPLSASPHRQPSHARTGIVYSGRHCLASPRLHACLSQDPHRATVLGAGGEGRLSREKTQARIPAPGRSLDSRYPLRIRHAVISSAAAEGCANTCSGGLAANHTPPTLTVKTHLTALRPHVRRPPPTSLRSPRVCLSLRSLSSLAWELLGESA